MLNKKSKVGQPHNVAHVPGQGIKEAVKNITLEQYNAFNQKEREAVYQHLPDALKAQIEKSNEPIIYSQIDLNKSYGTMPENDTVLPPDKAKQLQEIKDMLAELEKKGIQNRGSEISNASSEKLNYVEVYTFEQSPKGPNGRDSLLLKQPAQQTSNLASGATPHNTGTHFEKKQKNPKDLNKKYQVKGHGPGTGPGQ